MSKPGPVHTATPPTASAVPVLVIDTVLLSIVFLVLLQPAPARAEDSFSIYGDALRHSEFTVRGVTATTPVTAALDMPLIAPPALPMPAPDTYLSLAEPELKTYSTDEFRPRGRSMFDKDPRNNEENLPMLRGTNVWQRMRDFRSQGRVRVLTLWECSGGNVSLQASKHGDPSLQWTSHWKGRIDTRRGVLDSLFAISIAGAVSGIRGATSHSGFAQSAKDGPTPPRLSAVAVSK